MTCKKPEIIKNKFISTIIGSLGVYLGIAFLLPISNFSVYITSYIHLNQDFVTMHYGMFLHLIMTFSISAANALGGILENSIGFFLTIFFGLLILLIGNIIFIYQQNIWLCYLLTSIMGIGAGISISLLGKNITFYYPEKKGLITGICSLIMVPFAAIFSIIGEKIIVFDGYTLKENEEFYPKEIAERINLYYILGFVFIPIGGLLAYLFIYEYNPENINNENKNEEQFILNENISTQDKNNFNGKENIINNNCNEIELTKIMAKTHVKQVIKTFRFWRLSLISFLIEFSISFMINTGRTFGAIIGINGEALQFLIVFNAISTVIFGPILGFLVDKKGALFLLRIISIIIIIPGILLTFYMEKTFIFIFSFIIDILGLAVLMVGFGPFIMEIYGIQESVILGGINKTISKLSDIFTIMGAFIVSFFYSKLELKNPYRLFYILTSICSFFSALLLFIETNEKYQYEDSSFEKENNNENELNQIN